MQDELEQELQELEAEGLDETLLNVESTPDIAEPALELPSGMSLALFTQSRVRVFCLWKSEA
jgi:hypothetical protein